MKYKVVLMAGMLLLGISASAQNYDEMKKQINSVKKSNLYIYGEATADTEDEAKGIAEDLLYQEINQWAAKKKKFKGSGNIIVNNKKEIQTSISMPRGDMFRHFVYVKKADLIPSDNAEIVGNHVAPSTSVVENIEAPVSSVRYPEVVNIISSYKDYYNMADKIKELKDAGRISHFARYASLEKPELYYLAIYNPSGKVVAILTPGENRTNVATGQPDKITNYSGCGAIGFIVKE